MTIRKHFEILEEIVEQNKACRTRYYKCKCECGRIFRSSKYNVNHGITVACGKGNCNKQVMKLLGKKFNRLTVISHISDGRYACKCECGNTTVATGWALKTGRHRSCGCYMREVKAKQWYKGQDVAAINKAYGNYKRAAEKRNYEFKLDIETFKRLIKSPCHYCGILDSMIWKNKKRTVIIDDEFKYNGIDRVDNSIGYTDVNCVSCCKTCNNSKSTLSVEEWKIWIERVYNKLLK